MRTITAVLLALASSCALAQPVTIVKIEGQPLVYMKDGKPNGCGLRMIGFHQRPLNNELEAFDVSVNVYLPGAGVVKIVSYDTSITELTKRSPPRRTHLIKGWLRAPGADATAPIGGKQDKGDDGFSLLYASKVDSIFAILKAQVQGTPIHIGIHRRGDDTQRIFAGPVSLSSNELGQLDQCMSELIR